jgi:hypothetical protein
MAAKVPKFGSVAEIFAALRDMGQGISENMIRRHIQKANLKQTAGGKFNVADVLDAINRHRLEDNKNQGAGGTGVHSQLKAKKLHLECQQLQLKIDEMKGLAISVSEHLHEMREMQGHWNSTLDYFVAEASALTKDAHLLERLEHLVSNTRKALVAKIETIEESTE